MKYAITFDLQPYDTDYAGGVSNTTYIRWIEQLRTGWFDTLVTRPRQQTESLVLVVARLEIDYLHPTGFFDGNGKIVGEIEDSERGAARVIFHISFRAADKEVASARQTTVLVNLSTRRPARFPADIVQRLEEA